MFKLLVVDDIETNGAMLEFALQLENLSVRTTTSATKGFQMAVSEQYHLLIVDRNMPDTDGKEFISNLKKRKEYREVPVFLLSDDPQETVEKDAEELGVQAWFKKPIDITRLVDEAKKITKQP